MIFNSFIKLPEKKDSKFEYKIKQPILLKYKTLNDSSFNALGGSSNFSGYYVQPRCGFSLKYNFHKRTKVPMVFIGTFSFMLEFNPQLLVLSKSINLFESFQLLFI